MMQVTITSAAGILTLLDKLMADLKIFALKKPNMIIDKLWPEISEAVETIQILQGDN